MKLSFVIPCYRSAASIGNVIERIEKTVEQDGRYNYEIICVNDYSPDNTLEVLRSLATSNANVKVVSLTKILDSMLRLWRDTIMLQVILLSVWMMMDKIPPKRCLD